MRGAWIEIIANTARFSKSGSRSPCGERGLKSPRMSSATSMCVAPHAGSVD